MCRLTAYLGEPLAAAELVYGGSHPLLVQTWAPRELLHGSVNADGWGVAWYHDGRPVRLARARPLWHEADLEAVLRTVRTRAAVAVVRNATPGIGVDESGLLPMVHGRWVFALNGFVPDFRRRHMRALRSGLPDELYGALVGVSDSETLFLLAVAALQRGASPVDALEEVRRTVLERVADEGPCQLAMVLTDGESLAAVRTSNVEAVNTLYVRVRGERAREGTLVASEPLDEDGGWRLLEPHGVVGLSTDAGRR